MYLKRSYSAKYWLNQNNPLKITLVLFLSLCSQSKYLFRLRKPFSETTFSLYCEYLVSYMSTVVCVLRILFPILIEIKSNPIQKYTCIIICQYTYWKVSVKIPLQCPYNVNYNLVNRAPIKYFVIIVNAI